MTTTETPAAPACSILPGRAVDIVHAAVERAGALACSIEITRPARRDWDLITAQLSHGSPRDEATGRTIFALLGMTSATCQNATGYARMSAFVPALGLELKVLLDTISMPELGDVGALVAEVDAQRADEPAFCPWGTRRHAAHDGECPTDAGVPVPEAIEHGQPGHEGDPGSCAGCHAGAFGAPAADEDDDAGPAGPCCGGDCPPQSGHYGPVAIP